MKQIALTKGKIALVNKQAEEMFGHDRHEMLGKPVEMLMPPRLHETHIEHREMYSRDPRLRPMGLGRELMGANFLSKSA